MKSPLKMVVIRDGDDITIMVQHNGATVADPSAMYGSVSRTYRVVSAKQSAPILELIPLTEPQLIGDYATEQVIREVGIVL